MVLPDLELSIGCLLIVTGALLLLVEVSSPGFFAPVPATVLIFLGVLQLMGIEIANPWAGGLIGIVLALCTAGFTVWMYARITPNDSPTTLSRDSLVGMEGQVQKSVDAISISGKVVIGSTEWSARSTGAIIPAGRQIKVVSSQGVHVVVEEVI